MVGKFENNEINFTKKENKVSENFTIKFRILMILIMLI